jgi:hypothetical protein
MLLQFLCGDCVRCNGLFDGSPSWKIERWIKFLALCLWLWRFLLRGLFKNRRRIDRDNLRDCLYPRWCCGATANGQPDSDCRNERPTSPGAK